MTWEMLKVSIQGDYWYSETLGYTITHTTKGFVSSNSQFTIKISNKFLRATDWRKIN